jgi:HD-GYP domain-containing protein (c-di-GMP phosphodiesterase class II)
LQVNFVDDTSARRAPHSPSSRSEDAITELAARLLDWMRDATPAGNADAGEIAARVEAGLCHLTGANAAAVLARRSPQDDLILLAATNATPALLAAAPETAPVFPARHLLAELPAQPLAPAQAEPHLQVFLGELWDFTRGQQSTLAAAHGIEAAGAPDWIVPLRSASPAEDGAETMTDAAQEAVAGLALLWLESGSTLPAPLRLALAAAAAQAGGWLAAALRLERLGRSYHQFAGVVAEAVDSLTAEEARRGRAVAYYAALIAEEMQLSAREAERIEFAALLHGIGKIAAPGGLLQKPEPLTADEREMVRHALLTGADWLREVEGFEEVAAIVRHQGERFDGGGYPDGLNGAQIPLGARVLAAALRFAAMTNARSDRRAMSVVGGGLHALQRESGGAFDPQVVAAFLRVMGRESGE